MAVFALVFFEPYLNIGKTDHNWSLVRPVNASSKASGACVFPTASASTAEETAWRLFVAASCPAGGTRVVWETWIEQLEMYQKSGPSPHHGAVAKRLHGSPLARVEALRAGESVHLLTPVTECGTMRGPPPNVIPGAKICEEARLNPEAQAFVAGNSYQVRTAQTTAAQKAVDIEFPPPAIEVKVDWIPGTDFNPPFTCSNPPQGVHVETIDGGCYAMAGIHISSKLLKNWVWATFEPQNMVTNPLRCITYGSCGDPWGSNPATSSGGASGFTQQTSALREIMKEANLAPEFFNYRLDGVQVEFTNADGTPTLLGNSIIEGENVGLKKDHASCITCHSVSSIKNDGTDGIATLVSLPDDPVGPQYQIPKEWIARDFVWSLGFACPDPTGTGEQNCGGATSSLKRRDAR
jgi:hypothetical protein